MAPKRPHTQKSLSEARSRENRYDELQKKTMRNPQQMNLGFDAMPPSRSDAEHLVDERRKQKAQFAKPRAKTVPKSQSKGSSQTKPSTKKESPHHAQPIHSSEKTKKREKTISKKKSTPSTSKQPKKRKADAKKPVKRTKSKPSKKGRSTRGSLHIQLSLPIFIVMVVVIALLSGSMIAWKIVDFRHTKPAASTSLSTTSATVVIEPGMSARTVSQLLAQHAVITDARDFERYLESIGHSRRIQAGTYEFTAGLSHALLAEMLVDPNTQSSVGKAISVFPGFTLEEIDDRLAEMGVIEAGTFIDAATYVVRERGLPFAEGWFLSGSYDLEAEGSVSLALAHTMQDAFNNALRPYLGELESRSITLADAVVIASLVQRETNDPEQMSEIAGVIYNRLQADMSIGIDAALRYRFDAWNRDLSEAELVSNDPYNVRRVKGLPPTGIGAPSPAAIQAAMQPATHDWLYYLHDGDGNLHFAETYAGHQDNIEKFF